MSPILLLHLMVWFLFSYAFELNVLTWQNKYNKLMELYYLTSLLRLHLSILYLYTIWMDWIFIHRNRVKCHPKLYLYITDMHYVGFHHTLPFEFVIDSPILTKSDLEQIICLSMYGGKSSFEWNYQYDKIFWIIP